MVYKNEWRRRFFYTVFFHSERWTNVTAPAFRLRLTGLKEVDSDVTVYK